LHAQGTKNDSIYFTSLKDDGPGGDVNGDGGATKAQPGDWKHLSFGAESDLSRLEYCVVKYGGAVNWGMIDSWNSSFTIKHSRIDSSAGRGIQLRGGDVGISVDSSVIADNKTGVYVGNLASVQPRINHSRISGNRDYGIENKSTTMVDAKYNYWGHPKGPTTETGPAYGDKVSTNVDYIPWIGLGAGVEYASGLNNADRILFDSEGNAHLLYSDGRSVFYLKSPDYGETFEETLFVAEGRYPALGVAGDDELHAVFIADDGLYYVKRINNGWPKTLLFSSDSLGPPSFIINGDSGRVVFNDHGVLRYGAFELVNPVLTDQRIIDPDARNGAIGGMRGLALGVAYEKGGRIYFRHRNEDGEWEEPLEICLGHNPSVSADDTVLYIIWEDIRDSLSNLHIVYAWDNATSRIVTLEDSLKGIGCYPKLYDGNFATWAAINDNWEIYLSYALPDFFHGEFSEPEDKSNTLSNSRYPQISVFEKDGYYHYLIFWTEGGDPYELLFIHDSVKIPFKGRITQDTTWRGEIIICGDVVVDSGVTLTIEPGTNVLVVPWCDLTSSGYDTTRAELIVAGNILALGTETDTISFKSYSSSPEAGDWYGIVLESPSYQGFAMEKPGCGIEAEKPLLQVKETPPPNLPRRGGEFRHGSEQGGEARFEYCLICDGVNGVAGYERSPVIIKSVIEHNSECGVYVQNDTTLIITGSTIRENTYGVKVMGLVPIPLASPLIENNDIVNNDSSGIYLRYLNARIVNNTIENNFDGIYCNGCLPEIKGNEIKDNRIGINHWTMTVIPRGLTVDGNLIVDNDSVGVICSGISVDPVIKRNSIEYNRIGILIEVLARPNLGNLVNEDTLDDGGNYILNSTGDYDLINLTPHEIM
ncbi:MAG TPA: right-handed parallel beta-helix repeat-containing protein, partial [bacterium (Candidatus Stahlbacteria)]|nr:right-handed parallel beta-helix repeat-containing protein [Candidatus Stahlbacteria bacterium]